MATYYWVGGAGTWTSVSTANWSLLSGGASGAGPATAADDVVFDSASNATGYSVTVGSNAVCKNITIAGPASGSVTVAGNSTWNIYGGFVFPASGAIWSNTSPVTFRSTSAVSITSNGITFGSIVTFDGVGGVWSLQDAFAINSANVLTLTNGIIDFNSKTVTCGRFLSSSANLRGLYFGDTGSINCVLSNATSWGMSNSTNATITGSKLVILPTNALTGTRTIQHGITAGNESNAVSVQVTAGVDQVTFTNGGNLLDIIFSTFTGNTTFGTGTFSVYGNLSLTSNMTITAGGVVTFKATSGTKTITSSALTLDFGITFNGIGGTFAFQDALTQGSTRNFTVTNGTVQLKAGATTTVGAFATSGTNQKFLQSTLAGSQATLSQATGTVNTSYLTIKDINVTGGAIWNAYVTSNNVNVSNNTGWDFYLATSSIYDSLRLRGYTGTVTDMLLQYYQYNGATSNSIQDAEIEYLVIKGFTTGSNVDRWYAYLASLGFTGTVSDMLFNYWKDPV